MRYHGCSCDQKLSPKEKCSKDVARCVSRATIFLEEAKQNKTGIFKETT